MQVIERYDMTVGLMAYPTAQDWMEVKRRALVTIGKTPVSEPDEKWKRRMLAARHSPIRYLTFTFYLEVPYWVSVHLCRHHVGCQPYVRSQRNDRQSEYDRAKAPQDAMVCMIWDMNGEALIEIAKKRLCNQASPETQQVVKMMCEEVLKVCPEYQGLFVPMCVSSGKCYELHPCGRAKKEVTNAAPVVHAHWELTKNEYHVPLYMCSNCKTHAWSKKEFDDLDDLYKSYCMCCGAKMDEEVERGKTD